MLKKLNLLITLLMLPFASAVFAQEGPSILSPNLGSVSYLKEANLTWKVIVADQNTVTSVVVNGETMDVPKGTTVVFEKDLSFNEGENKLVVIARNSLGKSTTKTFLVFHSTDPDTLASYEEEREQAEGTSKESKVENYLDVAVGYRYESNLAHLSNEMDSDYDEDDLAGSATSGSIAVGRTAPFSRNSPYSYNAQLMAMSENFEDKKIEREDGSDEVDFSELSLSAYSLLGEVRYQKETYSAGLAYSYVRFDGNASDPEDNTTDNGDEVTMHVLIPSGVYVQSEQMTHMLAWALFLKAFNEEPDDEESDRDGFAHMLYYDLLYYLPQEYGKFDLKLGAGAELTEGDYNQHNQSLVGLAYDMDFPFKSIDSKLNLELGLESKSTDYVHVNEAVSDDDNDLRETDQITSNIALKFSYSSLLTTYVGYSNIKADSTLDAYTFDTNIFSVGAQLHLSF